jgi:hypothetical protein
MMLPFRSRRERKSDHLIADPFKSSLSTRMKIALLFLLIGAIVWWSHVGTSPTTELTDETVGPA